MAVKPMTLKPNIARAAIGAAVAGAMTLTATPAFARHRDDDGIDAGEVIAGAVILGGLAAILSSNGGKDRYGDRDVRYDNGRYDNGGYDNGRYDNDRYGDRDGRYGDNRYGNDRGRYGNSRSAVNQCVTSVEQRSGRYGRTDVTEIRSIDRIRGGYEVRGRVVVRDGYRGNWGRGRGGSYDQGRFSCTVRYGRVDDIRLSGLG
ncbi:MAG: hypothetical protein RLZZ58_1334 [Pseudomonadota bacterium]|jgi:hypothetical protein